MSCRALDKLLFRMSTVLVHLKKNGITKNFKEYSLNAINNVLHVCKKRKSFINTLFHKGYAGCLFGNRNPNGQKLSSTLQIPIMSPFGDINMEKNLIRHSHHTFSLLSLGLTATNITKVPESLSTRFAGSLVGRLPLISSFTLDKNRAHSIRIRWFMPM